MQNHDQHESSFESVLPDADYDHSDESSCGQNLLEPNDISPKAADSDVESEDDSEAGGETGAEADSDTEIKMDAKTAKNKPRGKFMEICETLQIFRSEYTVNCDIPIGNKENTYFLFRMQKMWQDIPEVRKVNFGMTVAHGIKGQALKHCTM